MSDKGITLGQWFRIYGYEPFEITSEEVAYGTLAMLKTPASPELLAYLVKMIEDEGLCPGARKKI